MTGIGASPLERMMSREEAANATYRAHHIGAARHARRPHPIGLGSMATADMVADDPGTWMLHCHVADHIAAGMLTTYTINP